MSENMNLNSKISVIIPVYNTEKYFERCIDSVLKQSYGNLEIIVVNDASSGNIDDIIRKYSDERIVYIRHEKNMGLFRARITGMKKASGDYIAFLDSDDYVSYDFYRTLLASAVEHFSDIVIGKTVWENEQGRYVYNYHESCFSFKSMEMEELRNAYFSQESACYSWHTVWNKLYSAELIKNSLKSLEKLDKHIIMTEDICFSSIFFYEAKRLSTVDCEAYFYCANADASTNTTKINKEKFIKNVSDIVLVFDFVEDYLKEKGASSDICKHFKNARLHYARMWKNLLDTAIEEKDKQEAGAKLDELAKDFSMKHIENEYFFESVKSPWKGALEYIKECISDSDKEYISFDIFDTLILRPFYEPTDLLELCDKRFRELSNSTVSFSKLRRNAEKLLRKENGLKNPDREDVTLSEIYAYMGECYKLPQEILKAMQEEEIRLEIRFAKRRESGCALFELAKYLNKKVLLVTDMYLERETIEAILDRNGIRGYERLYISCEERRLKYNGGLFRCVLRDYPDAKHKLIHIGDTWASDIEGSNNVGMESIFLPKAKEIFENKIEGYCTNQCAVLGKNEAGQIMDADKPVENLGIKAMKALVVSRYFDNPYRLFNEESNLNADPFFIGYYVVGMHMLSLCKWIDKETKIKKNDTIHFLSRDGYLAMKAFEIYKSYIKNPLKLSYLYTSRKSMMPFIVENKLNFYELPVEYRAHTPKSLLKLISFASKELSDSEAEMIFKSAGISYEQPIVDEAAFYSFINCFLDKLYDENKHEAAKQLVRAYFSDVRENDIVFDMGYSGRIQQALSNAAGHPVDALFLHEDYKNSSKMKAYQGFEIKSFYDFRPSVSGLFREHLLSECSGSCIEYTDKGAQIEAEEKYYSDRFVIESIQRGALNFVEDYMREFEGFYDELDFSPIEASLPYEGFIRQPSCVDLHIFSASYFEDEVWGASDDINIEQFLKEQTNKLNEKHADLEAFKKIYQNDTFMEIMNKKSKPARALLWAIAEPGRLKEKTKINIKRILREKR